MRQRIRIRERLPVWALRLTLGVMLLTISELVMWQNPTARSPIEWPILLVLYVALASILMDLVVRFQVNSPATLLLVSGICGLVSASIINHSAFASLPYSLIVQGFALQTGAALYSLLLYVSVMRGRQLEPIHIAAAAALGVLWGIWVHWYPLRTAGNWGPVSIETATLYIVPALVILGLLLIGVVPRFQFFREKQLELLWWEAIVVGLPLFVALVVGMLQDLIPFPWLLVIVGIGAYMVWALSQSRRGYEPSILAEATFAAPNAITYIVLGVAFLVAGTLSYSLVTDAESPIGVAAYVLVLVAGFLWLPGASGLVFLEVLRRQRSIDEPLSQDKDG
jgi:hypothetical protein